MSEKSQQDREQDQKEEQVHTDPRGSIPPERSGRGVDSEKPDAFQGDRDVLDEDSPIDFQVEEEGELVPDSLEEDPAQNYRINRLEIEDDEERIGHYTDDDEVIEDFAIRQRLGDSAGEQIEKLEQYHGLSPQTSADDVDAAWEKADQSGEESVGGSNPTPDQDVVEEIGEAAGLTYRDDEPLDYSKINERDEKRWELQPESAIENDEELESLDALAEEEDLEDLEELDDLDGAFRVEKEDEEDQWDEDEDDDDAGETDDY